MESLGLFKARAYLVKSQNPELYLTEVVELPDSERELFFDIKVTPCRTFAICMVSLREVIQIIIQRNTKHFMQLI